MERNRENMDQQASFADWISQPEARVDFERSDMARLAHAKGYKDGFDAALDLIGDPDQNRDRYEADHPSRGREPAGIQNRDRYGAETT
jgi:hypothetical protein